MKTKNFFLALTLTVFLGIFSVSTLNAQVTIGGGTPPQPGATLDLNAAFTGGLLLPNVEITDLGKIPHTFSDASVQGADIVLELTGLVVYNTNTDENIIPGIYVWDGDNWQLIAVDGGVMSIPYSTPGFDPGNPIPADGGNTGETPIINPGLNVRGDYTFTVIAGSEFASVTPIDLSEGIFIIDFQPNPTAGVRRAVILVTDPAGRTSTFVFTQLGNACTDNFTVEIDVHGGSTVLCQSGSVHAFVASVNGNTSENAIRSNEYFWLRNGILIAQGVGMELSQTGTYTVYANMIGCGTPGKITITASNNTASPAPHIIADNNGILCGTNGVTLSALNTPNPATGLIWLKDGLEQARDVSSFYVPAGETSEGVWYLIYTTGDGCSSVSSNKINIIYTDGTSDLPTPDAQINGISINAGSMTVCAGGTLELTVANASDYSSFSNVEYEWFGNGQSLGRTTATTMFVVPPSYTNLVLSVTVTAIGECPMSKTSNEFTVLQGSTPLATSINRGDERAYICAVHPAVLTAGITGSAYQWFRNGVELPTGTNPLSVTQPGTYTVRYANAVGCWSMVSAPIEVIQSAPVTISWLSMPAATEFFESSRTYSVAVAPNADIIEWVASDPSIAVITKLGNGNAAIVTYGNTPSDDFQITVRATNACGTAELISDPITVELGCIPAGSVVVTPSSAQTIRQGESITFTVSANTGSEPITYRWAVTGTATQSATGNTFIFAPTVVGNYQIQAFATASCDVLLREASSAIVEVAVTINPRQLPNPTPGHQVAFFGGKSCLDVHTTGGTYTDNPWIDGERLPLSIRPNDFNNGNRLSFNYTFRGTNISNIRFIMDDPQSLVESVTGDANASQATATVTFRHSAFTGAAGTTGITALTTTLFAVYDAGGQTFSDSIVIRIQDQACGCPARVGSTTWQMFECHNLGADRTANPFIFNTAANRRALFGNYYAWGRRLPTRRPDGSLFPAANRPTSTRPSATGAQAWQVWEDPCQYGWRVGTEATWSAVHSNNSRSRPNSFIRFGDYLILPAQGYAPMGNFSSGGLLDTSGPGFHYWTRGASTAAGGRNMYRLGGSTASAIFATINKNYAENIRCVQEGVPFQQGGQW